MKTKIKRHYRSVVSVLLSVCMLVSCIAVGLIGTDAARVDGEEVGATKYYIWVSDNGGSSSSNYTCLGASPQSFSASKGKNYYIAISTSRTDISSGSVWLTGADFDGLSVSSKGTQSFDSKQAYRFSLSVADTVTVSYSSGSKVTVTGTGATGTDAWYLYGDKFGGWSWTTASTDLTALTEDSATHYYYAVHTVPSSGNDRFRIYNTNGNKHYKPASSTQLTSSHNSQANGVEATEGWSSNYFGLESNFAGQTVRIWFDTSSKKVWVTPNTCTVTRGTQTGGTVTVDGKSSVTDLPADGTATVDLVATPSTNYHFVNWVSNENLQYANQTSASTTATVYGTATVTAVFALDTYAVTLTDGTGYTLSTDQDDNTAVAYGTPVTVTATPGSLYKITAITVTPTAGGAAVATETYATNGAQTLSFTMPAAAVTVTATATPLPSHKITYGITDDSDEDSGYVSVGEQYNSESDEMKHTIDSGDPVLETTTVNFCARPAAGYKFVGWYDAAEGGTLRSTSQDYSVTGPSGDYFARFSKFAIAEENKIKILVKSATNSKQSYAYGGVTDTGTNITKTDANAITYNGDTYYLVEYTYTGSTATSFISRDSSSWNYQSKAQTGMVKGKVYVVTWDGTGKYNDQSETATEVDYTKFKVYYPIKYYVNNPDEGAASVHSEMFVEAGTSNTATFNHTPDDTDTTKVKRTSEGFNGTNYTDDVTKDSTSTRTMPASYPEGGLSFTVEFIEKDKYAVTFDTNDATKGTVTAKVGDVAIASGDLVYEDQEVEFTATPVTGKYFNMWSGDASGTTTPTTLTVDSAAINVIGKFRDPGYKLYINSGGGKYHTMVEIAGGLYMCTQKQKKSNWFQIYRESDSNYSQKQATINGYGRDKAKTIASDQWSSTSNWSTKALALNDDSPFSSTDDANIIFDPATGDVWAIKDAEIKSVTLNDVDHGTATVSYGGVTIDEGETIEDILVGESVSINVLPEIVNKTPYTIDTVTGTYDTSSTATITGGGNARTMTMPAGDTTVSITMKTAPPRTVYFNNYYSKYPMVSAYAWYGTPDQTEKTLEPLGIWSGQTMTKLDNTNTWSVQVPEGTPYIIFVGKGGNTNSSDTVGGVAYYHITIPWENTNPMYTAGSNQASPTTNGTWKNYKARNNEHAVYNGSTITSSVYSSIKATFYDYYVDNELDGSDGTKNWISGIKDYNSTGPVRADYSTGNGNDFKWNPYKTFNKALSDHATDFGVTYPLYIGNLNLVSKDGGTLSIDKCNPVGTGETKESEIISGYTNWSTTTLANNSGYLSDGSTGVTAVTGLTGKTLAGDNIHYYQAGAENDNGAVMAYFDEDFLSGENTQGETLAEILRSESFPMHIHNKTYDGTEYQYYEYDSTDGNDNAFITKNATTNKYEIDYYAKAASGNKFVKSANDKFGFFPFDYAQASNSGGLAKDLGFGMKLEIPFTINEGGLIKTVANGGTNVEDNHQKFKFSGDDDLWVFIDGHLVLDLGGDHSATTGEIDFADMEATGDRTESIANGTGGAVLTPNTTSFGTDGGTTWFDKTKPNVIHTMTIYYMERGMFSSNLQFGFSFHPVPNLLTVDKKVRTNYVNSGFFETTTANTAKNSSSTAYKNDQGADITQFEHTYQADYVSTDLGVTVPSGETLKTEQFTINQSSDGIHTGNTGITYAIGSSDYTPTLGNGNSFSYQLYNDQGANFIQQYDGGQKITVSEGIPEDSLYHYYKYGDTLPDGTTFENPFSYTNIAQLDANGKEKSLGHDYVGEIDGKETFRVTMPSGTGGMDDIRVRARFTNQMKTHDLTLVKNVNDSNPNESFTFVVKFKFGNYDFQPYKLYCVVDGQNQQMNENGEITVRHGHSVIIPKVPENAIVEVSEKISGSSDYAFNDITITGAETCGSVLNGKQFRMGTTDATATVRNTKSELEITHFLHPDSAGTATCTVSAKVKNGGNTVESYPASGTANDITIDPTYIKNDSNYTLEITLTTTGITDPYVFSEFYEQIYSAMNVLNDSSGTGLDLDATVTVNKSTPTAPTATISFAISKLFDSTTKGQKVSVMPFYSKLEYKYKYDFTYKFTTRKLIKDGKMSNDTLWGDQSYRSTGSFTNEEVKTYLDLTGDNPVFKADKSAEFLAAKSPYETNFMEDLTWTFTGQTISYDPETFTFSCEDLTAGQDLDTTIHVSFMMPFEYTLDTSTPNKYTFAVTKENDTDKEVYKDYDDVTTVRQTINMDFLDWFSLNDVHNQSEMTEDKQPELLKVPDVLYNEAINPDQKRTFRYWEYYTENADGDPGVCYQKSYSSTLNQAIYQNTILKPVYSEEKEMSAQEQKEVMSDKTASITFLGTTRDQWNYGGGGDANGLWGNSKFGDRIFTDFMLSFEYEGKQINTIINSNFNTGLIIETLDVGDITDLEDDWVDTYQSKNGDGTEAARTKIKATTEDTAGTATAGSYMVSFVNKSKLDPRNGIEYYYGIANVSSTTNRGNDTYTKATTRRNFGYRAYSFIKYGTGDSAEVIISNPVYFTIYDIATITDGSRQAKAS
ncbi:InlB B-repeat-containing protein [Lachnoclostridium sp. MSJ-17]|uniref:InlB B-repeat-containing protein n=1 Tax=Lachnoclostridium sp. MSJ-17 TaxID=2841516 RepID=UPI001C11005B|nr:fibro-slime domain-containing protein [Lachnoclostridium sp. MSJ-17]MBU5462393.1 fibro-slime domain-containing protein [Lachnoclostridium sp. MSJ-17]